MAESALTLGYQDFVEAVGYLLFGARTTYDEGQMLVIHRAIDSGYRTFLSAHEWRFLRPVGTITAVAGASTYALPDDFGSLLSGFDFSMDSGYPRAEVTNQGKVSSLLAYSSTQGTPFYSVLRPLAMNGTSGQRYEVEFYPIPDQEYELTYEYNLIPSYRLREATPFPVGGELHSNTINEAMLMEAENAVEDSAGLHTAKYQALLANSISIDGRNTPDTLGFRDGYGGDMNSPYPCRRSADRALIEGIDY